MWVKMEWRLKTLDRTSMKVSTTSMARILTARLAWIGLPRWSGSGLSNLSSAPSTPILLGARHCIHSTQIPPRINCRKLTWGINLLIAFRWLIQMKSPWTTENLKRVCIFENRASSLTKLISTSLIWRKPLTPRPLAWVSRSCHTRATSHHWTETQVFWIRPSSRWRHILVRATLGRKRHKSSGTRHPISCSAPIRLWHSGLTNTRIGQISPA